MTKAKWVIKFTTGHSRDIKYYHSSCETMKQAEDELYLIYCGGNTTILSCREILK